MTLLEKRQLYVDKLDKINQEIDAKCNDYSMKLYNEADIKVNLYQEQLLEQVKQDIEKCQRYIDILDEMIADESNELVIEQSQIAESAVEQPVVEVQSDMVNVQEELHKATEAFDHATGRVGMASIENPRR